MFWDTRLLVDSNHDSWGVLEAGNSGYVFAIYTALLCMKVITLLWIWAMHTCTVEKGNRKMANNTLNNYYLWSSTTDTFWKVKQFKCRCVAVRTSWWGNSGCDMTVLWIFMVKLAYPQSPSHRLTAVFTLHLNFLSKQCGSKRWCRFNCLWPSRILWCYSYRFLYLFTVGHQRIRRGDKRRPLIWCPRGHKYGIAIIEL